MTTLLLRLLTVLCIVFLSSMLIAQQDTLSTADSLATDADTLQSAVSARIITARRAIDTHMRNYERTFPADIGTAIYEARAALDSARVAEDAYAIPKAQLAISRCLLARGDTTLATTRLQESLAGFTVLDDLASGLEPRLMLAELASARRDTAEAIEHYRQSWEDANRLSDNTAMRQAGAELVEMYIESRSYEDALALIPEVREAAHAGDDKPLATQMDIDLAKLQWLGGMQQTALSTAQTAVVYANSRGDLKSMHEAYELLATFEEQLEEPEKALRHYRLAWELDRSMLQREHVLSINKRDSLLHHRELRIEDMERFMQDMQRNHDNMAAETQSVRSEMEQLRQAESSAKSLKAQVRWMALITALAIVLALVGWIRFTRLRVSILQEQAKLPETDRNRES